MTTETTGVPAAVRNHQKRNVWFWKPEIYWYGWKTLLPAFIGHDEYARTTIVLGWTITGRVVVAIKYCGESDCYADAAEWIEWMKDNPDD